MSNSNEASSQHKQAARDHEEAAKHHNKAADCHEKNKLSDAKECVGASLKVPTCAR